MNPLQFVMIALWALVFIRLIAARSTLGTRTLLRWLAVGALLGPLSIGLASNIVNPFGWVLPDHTIAPNGIAAINVLKSLAALGALVVPLWLIVFVRREHRALSVADAFVLGFVVGFGCDMLTMALHTAIPDQPSLSFSIVPAAQLVTTAPDMTTTTLAGYGWWCGGVMLAIAVASRFVRRGIVTLLAGIAALLWFALDHAAAISPAGTFTDVATTVGLHGALTPWLVVLATIGFSVFEALWVSKRAPTTAPAGVIAQCQAVGTQLVTGNLFEAIRQSALYRLRRQQAIADAERAIEPARMPLSAARIGERLSKLESDGPGATPHPTQLLGGLKTWAAENWQDVAGWTLAALVFLVFPHLFGGDWLWKLPAFSQAPQAGQTQSGWTLSALDLLLIGVLLWRYVTAADPASIAAPDVKLRATAEQLILQTTLGICVLALFFVRISNIFRGQVDPDTTPSAFFDMNAVLPPLISGYGLAIPALDRIQWVTVLTVLAVAATGLTLALNRAFFAMTAGQRRALLTRRALTAVGTAIVLVVGVWLFNTLFALFQRLWFPVEAGSLNFTVLSLYVIAAAIIVLPVSYGLMLLLRMLVARVRARPTASPS